MGNLQNKLKSQGFKKITVTKSVISDFTNKGIYLPDWMQITAIDQLPFEKCFFIVVPPKTNVEFFMGGPADLFNIYKKQCKSWNDGIFLFNQIKTWPDCYGTIIFGQVGQSDYGDSSTCYLDHSLVCRGNQIGLFFKSGQEFDIDIDKNLEKIVIPSKYFEDKKLTQVLKVMYDKKWCIFQKNRNFIGTTTHLPFNLGIQFSDEIVCVKIPQVVDIINDFDERVRKENEKANNDKLQLIEQKKEQALQIIFDTLQHNVPFLKSKNNVADDAPADATTTTTPQNSIPSAPLVEEQNNQEGERQEEERQKQERQEKTN